MNDYTVEIPFQTLGNRRVLTRQQVEEMPWLLDFIKRFPKCFEYAWPNDYFVFYPDGDAPKQCHLR
jgi:hypothetical protein